MQGGVFYVDLRCFKNTATSTLSKQFPPNTPIVEIQSVSGTFHSFAVSLTFGLGADQPLFKAATGSITFSSMLFTSSGDTLNSPIVSYSSLSVSSTTCEGGWSSH